MSALVVDASTSEFGWELMSWQGFVRKQAPKHSHVVVVTTAGLEPLYAGVNAEFITHDVPMGRDCWWGFDVADTRKFKRHTTGVAATANALKRKYGSVTYLKQSKYIPIQDQTFVKYGNSDANSADVIVHARRKKNRPGSCYDIHNWPQPTWDAVANHLVSQGLSVAAVGTKTHAMLPAGCTDLRGLALPATSDAIAGAKCMLGPSSGPMHLAALCGTRHIVWGRNIRTKMLGAMNVDRYTHLWNPFSTPCTYIPITAVPSEKDLIGTLDKELQL